MTPLIRVVNESSLRVSWAAPITPNGPVIGYYIFVNGLETDPETAIPGSYVITGLQPYTVYSILVSEHEQV